MSSYIITENDIVCIIDGKPYQFDSAHPRFEDAKQAIRDQNWSVIPQMIDRVAAINAFGDGKVEVIDGVVMWNGSPLHNTITTRILRMLDEGFNIDPMVRFLEKLMRNPSQTAIDELYLFLEACKLPITEEGNFVAYKAVGSNWFDMHSGTCNNKPAALMNDDELAEFPYQAGDVTISIENGRTVLSMKRENVDPVRDRTCSYGLHFCSREYLGSFAYNDSRILLVEIDPADVVSIPSDYNNTKGRTAKYTVMSEIHVPRAQLKEDVFNESVVSNAALENSYEYIQGYVFGYDQGRNKEEKFPPDVDQTARYTGYLAGYKDGRGHSSRKYKAEDLERYNNGSATF